MSTYIPNVCHQKKTYDRVSNFFKIFAFYCIRDQNTAFSLKKHIFNLNLFHLSDQYMKNTSEN